MCTYRTKSKHFQYIYFHSPGLLHNNIVYTTANEIKLSQKYPIYMTFPNIRQGHHTYLSQTARKLRPMTYVKGALRFAHEQKCQEIKCMHAIMGCHTCYMQNYITTGIRQPQIEKLNYMKHSASPYLPDQGRSLPPPLS